MYWAVGLFQGQLDDREDVRIRAPQANYDCEGLGRQFEEEYILG